MQTSWIYNAVLTVYKNTWTGPTQDLTNKAHIMRKSKKGQLYLTDGHYMIPIFLNVHQQDTKQGSEDISRIPSGTELRIKSFDFKLAKKVKKGNRLYIQICDWCPTRKPNKIDSKKLVDINTLPIVREMLITRSGKYTLSQSPKADEKTKKSSNNESHLAPGYCLKLSEETPSTSRHVDAGWKQELLHTVEQTSLASSASLPSSGPEETLTLHRNIAIQTDSRWDEETFQCNCQTLKYKPDFNYWIIPPEQKKILDQTYALPPRQDPHKAMMRPNTLQQKSSKRLCMRPNPEERIQNWTHPVSELATSGHVDAEDAGRKENLLHSVEQTSPASSGSLPSTGPERNLNIPINKIVTTTQNDLTVAVVVCQCCNSQTLKLKPNFFCWKIPEDQKRFLDEIPEWKSSYQLNLSSSLMLSQVGSEADMCTEPGSQEPATNSSFREHQNRINSVIRSQDLAQTDEKISADKVNSGSLFSDNSEKSEDIDSDKHITSTGPETSNSSSNRKMERNNKASSQQQSQTRLASSGISVSGKPSTSSLCDHSLQAQDSCHSDPTVQQLSSESEIATTVMSRDPSLQSLKQVVRIPIIELCDLDCRVSDGTKPSGVKRGCQTCKLRSQGQVDAGNTPSGQVDEDNTPSGLVDAGNTPSGQVDEGDTPSGQVDAGNTPSGQVDEGNSPSGQVDAGIIPLGQVDAGSTPSGQVDEGSTPSGQVDAGIIPSGQVDAGTIPSGQVDAGTIPSGQVDAGNTPSWQVDEGSTPAGQVDAGIIPSGQVDAGSTPSGQVDEGNTPSGQVDDGSTPSGQVDEGMIPSGQVDAGNTPSGQVDEGSTPSGQVDASNTPSGQVDEVRMPSGQVDEGNTPSGQVDEGNTPSGQVDEVRMPSGQVDEGNTLSGQVDARKQKLLPSTEQTTLVSSVSAAHSQDSLISVHSFSPAFSPEQNLNLPNIKIVTTTQNDSTVDEEVCQCCNFQNMKIEHDFHYWIIPADQEKILDLIPEWKSSYQPSLSSALMSQVSSEAYMCTDPGSQEPATNSSFREHQNRINSVIRSQDLAQTNEKISADKVNSGSLFSDNSEKSEDIDSDKHIISTGPETSNSSNNRKVERNNKTSRHQGSQSRVVSSGISERNKLSTSSLCDHSPLAQDSCHSDPTVQQLSSESENATTVMSLKQDPSLRPLKQVVRIPVIELCDLDCRVSEGAKPPKRVCKACNLGCESKTCQASHSKKSSVNSQMSLSNDSLDAIMSFISSGNKAGFIHH